MDRNIDYSSPNTRSRVEALRRWRRSRHTNKRYRLLAYLSAQVFAKSTKPTPKRVAWVRPSPRAHTPYHTTRVPRTRSHARRLQVQPTPRRVVQHWCATGKIASIALFFASTITLLYILFSSQFHVQAIHITGNHLMKAHTIAQIIQVNEMPVWFVDTHTISERLSHHSYIEHASVRIALPNRLEIHIIERQPEVRWQAGTMHYLVDRHGIVIDIADTVPTATTLVIYDSTHHQLALHESVDPDAIQLAQALSLRLPAELSLTPTQIGWDMGLGVYIRTAAEQQIIFGQSERLDEKVAILGQLLQENITFRYLDLRPTNPFYKPLLVNNNTDGVYGTHTIDEH